MSERPTFLGLRHLSPENNLAAWLNHGRDNRGLRRQREEQNIEVSAESMMIQGSYGQTYITVNRRFQLTK